MWYNKDTNVITLYGPRAILEEAFINVCGVIEGYVKKFAPESINNVYNANNQNTSEEMIELSLEDTIDVDDVKYIIGKEGNIFKEITKKTNVYFIWYDNDKHSINIWGTKYHTINAIKQIQSRINVIKQKVASDAAQNIIQQQQNTQKRQRID
jgi:polyribonucleotide nucleotidyltransferase